MGWLDGVSAIVTGGGSGIGQGVARRFVQEGAQVAIFDKVPERAKAAGEEIGPGAIGIHGDVTRFEDNERAVAEAVKAFGKLDVFVGNAGLWDFSTPLVDLPGDRLAAAFDELFGVNVKGYVLGAKAALPELLKTEGSLIFTVSNAGFWPGGGGILYTASKHAVVGLIQQLALELTPTVRVNGVAPGGVVTDLRGLGAFDQANMSAGESIRQRAGPAVLASFSTPADLAGAYVFLASKQNSPAVFGTVIDNTNGMLVKRFKGATGGGGGGNEGRAASS